MPRGDKRKGAGAPAQKMPRGGKRKGAGGSVGNSNYAGNKGGPFPLGNTNSAGVILLETQTLREIKVVQAWETQNPRRVKRRSATCLKRAVHLTAIAMISMRSLNFGE